MFQSQAEGAAESHRARQLLAQAGCHRMPHPSALQAKGPVHDGQLIRMRRGVCACDGRCWHDALRVGLKQE